MGEGGAVFTNNPELKKMAESSVTGVEIATALLEKTTPVANVLDGSWANYLSAMTTNIHTVIWATTLRLQTCKLPVPWRSWTRPLALSNLEKTTLNS
jgi:hypothetical protein